MYARAVRSVAVLASKQTGFLLGEKLDSVCLNLLLSETFKCNHSVLLQELCISVPLHDNCENLLELKAGTSGCYC